MNTDAQDADRLHIPECDDDWQMYKGDGPRAMGTKGDGCTCDYYRNQLLLEGSDKELEARFLNLVEFFKTLETSTHQLTLRVAALNQKLQELRDDYHNHTFYHSELETGE